MRYEINKTRGQSLQWTKDNEIYRAYILQTQKKVRLSFFLQRSQAITFSKIVVTIRLLLS